jgi:multiple sugar transport system substrate-binding protein
MPDVLHGLTWEHPRAWRGLEAACADVPGVDIRWERQSLAGFEHEPLVVLAERFDVLVVDHPGLGAAIAGDALVPLADLVEADELRRWESQSVAGTWASYRVDGTPWALPLDAATQAVVLRADLLAGPSPRSWRDVLDVAGYQSVALCLGGPHAGLLLLALAADRRPGATGLLDEALATAAVELLRDLWQVVDREASELDPIGLHDLMTTTDEVALCPLTYTYALYGAAPGRPVSFAPAPSFDDATPGSASVLGGTGLAVSARALDRPDAVRAALRRLMDPGVQLDVVAPLGGQPAVRTVWDSPVADAAVNGHYGATRTTLDGAYLRPRHDGWIAFQDTLSHRVREAITSSMPATQVATQLADAYGVACTPATQEAK